MVDGEVVWQVESTGDLASAGSIEKRCTSCVGNGGPCIPGKGRWSKNGGPFTANLQAVVRLTTNVKSLVSPQS